MSGIVRLEHVALPTSEETFEPTVRFYHDLFGWKTIKEIGYIEAFVSNAGIIHTAEFLPLPASLSKQAMQAPL